jgi:multidrug efflux pump
VSQMLTLYTTPIVYLLLDRFRLRARVVWHRILPGARLAGSPAE